MKTGAINVGGGELITTTYTLRVNDRIKGQLSEQSGKINNIIELQMVGSQKSQALKTVYVMLVDLEHRN
ncbi:MAG: hypothetical protein ACJAYF_000187 [Arenicella sp.]